jgi:hypothetical protein
MATHQVTPRRTEPQPFNKPALYEAIAALNRDLGMVIEDLNRLREFRFSRRDIDGFIAKAERLRSRANSEFLERQLDRELKDDHYFWKLDVKYEDRYKDPNDVLIGARQRLQEMAVEERDALALAHGTRERRERAEQDLSKIIKPAEPTEPTEPTESTEPAS